jgi:O-antigen/teichoic acid export membrane protein
MLVNSIRNLAGAAIPAAISILTIPFIVKGLGDESYGAFALISSIIGYFALLDINVTSGSVKYVAEHNARGERRELLEVISFGGLMYVAIGIVGSVAIYFFAESLTGHVFVVSKQLKPLFTRTLQVAALGFLISQLQVYLNSIPQSLQRYDITAALEVTFGIGVPLGTVGLLWLGYGLWEMVVFRVAASAINVLLLLLIVGRLVPDFRWVWPSGQVARKLASFSGYSYLSRIAAITYNHADKLIIGAFVSMSELAYYTVPVTLVNRLLGLTFRMGSVLYPVASELDALGDHGKLERIYLSATRYLNYINTFFVMIVSLFAYQILYWWLGDAFAAHGRWIMIMMALSMLIDSFTNLPSLLNDGLGYPRMTGIFAVLRALIGLGLTLILTKTMGIAGAALSHLAASALLSGVFLVFVHRKTLPVSLGRVIAHSYLPSAIIAVLCFALAFCLYTPQSHDRMQFLLSAGAVTALYLGLGVMLIVEPEHRMRINQRCKRLLGQTGSMGAG